MERFKIAKLTPASESFLKEKEYWYDDCFPLDWHSSLWSLLSVEGTGQLAGYELNQLKNVLLAHDTFELLREISIRSVPLDEDIKKRLEEANYTHFHHLPFCPEDSWWDIASTQELLLSGQQIELQNYLFELESSTTIAPMPPPRAGLDMTEFFEEDLDKCDVPTSRLHDLVVQVHTSANQYRRAVYVMNSTGSGKTYACLQLCNRLPSAYIICESSNSVHPVSAEIAEVVRSIDAEETTLAKYKIAACFVRALENSLRVLTAGGAKDLQFEGSKYMGIKNLLTHTWEELNSSTDNFKDCLKARCKGVTSVSTLNNIAVAKRVHFEGEVVNCIDSAATISSPLLVVFDDADGLLGQKCDVDDERCPLRCIQRALERSTLIGLFLCTSACLKWTERYNSSSRCTYDMKETKTFIEMCAHDQFQDHPFFLGRPLWEKQFRHREGRSMRRLVEFAVYKLTSGRETISLVNDNHRTAEGFHCALFTLRFGFEPESEYCSQFVSNYMAITVKSGDHKQGAACQWLSEPILAEVSSSMTMNLCAATEENYTMRAVTRAVQDCMSCNVIRPSSGDRGEVIVGAVLGYTLDILKSAHIESFGSNAYDPGNMSRNMSCDAISAAQFLTALGIAAPDGCDEYRVSFTHFMRVDVTVTEDICYQAVDRKAALYVTAGAKALDLLIVAHKAGDTPGTLQFLPIRVQVKNLETKLTVASAVKLASGMSPAAQCQPILPVGGLEIGIVIAIGAGGTNQTEGVSEAIIKPSTSPHMSVSQHSPYYGFLLSLENSSHFQGLRAYKGPDGRSNDGIIIIGDLMFIAQNHLPTTEVDDCFTEWFDRHGKGVKERRRISAGKEN